MSLPLSRIAIPVAKNDEAEGEALHLSEVPIILRVPSISTKLDLVVWIPDETGEKLIKVAKTVTPKELGQARKDFLDSVGIDNYDATFSIAAKGREAAKGGEA